MFIVPLKQTCSHFGNAEWFITIIAYIISDNHNKVIGNKQIKGLLGLSEVKFNKCFKTTNAEIILVYRNCTVSRP